MPVADLIAPVLTANVLCDESIAAGKEVLAGGSDLPSNDYSRGGVHMIYEARDDAGKPCVYPFVPWMPRPGSGKNAWETGSQFVWRSSEAGTRVTFKSDSQWAAMNFKTGQSDGKRYHMEVVDLDLDFTGSVQPSGALWFQSYPDGASGGLSSLVIRNSRITGGKNALFAPSGAIMIYAEDSEIGRNLGINIDQEHAIYLNGVLTSHFKDTLIFGQRASSGAGGHILKAKSAVRILENVTLDNGGGVLDPTNRPLGDFSGFGWTWSDGLNLIRRAPTGDYRPVLVDMRRDYYFGKRLNLPWSTAAGWEMPTAPGDCSGNVANDVYLHVFRDTVVNSEVSEESVFRMSGVVDIKHSGIHGKTSHAEIVANPRRNRGMLLSFNTQHEADAVTADGYFYLKPAYQTYHCENGKLAPKVAALAGDRDAFVNHALKLINAANGNAIPLKK